MQVSFLVRKMSEESKGRKECATRKRLRDKIASLSQPQMKRAADILAMIWNCVKEPPDPPTVESKATFSTTPILFPNWHRVKLAFLKSITTGVFIDVQFHAFNKIDGDLPQDPKPLYTSSIVIEGWATTITACEFHESTRSDPL
jgi:hypothetical protein